MNTSEKNAGFVFEPGEEFIEMFKLHGAKEPISGTPRKEGEGPYKRLILRNAWLIDGTGNPVHGPHDIVISGGEIKEIRHCFQMLKAEPGDREIDCTGKYVMPGFVNAHVHIGCSSHGVVGDYAPSDYVYKLWLAHGITTVRDCGSLMGYNWTNGEAQKSERNEITAPRIVAYPCMQAPWATPDVADAKAAKAWVDYVEKKGVKGIKLFGQYPDVMETVIKEATARGLKTSCHHSVNFATAWTLMDSVKAGLTSIEHFLGFGECLTEGHFTENYPLNYNYDLEQQRALQDAHMWRAIEPGSPKWRNVIETMGEHGVTLCPTFAPWEPARDISRFKNNEWHKEYTWPPLWTYFQPNPICHWSYYWDWTTGYELEMRHALQKWMQFVYEYKAAGGRVVTGDDTGFAYTLYGFDYIRELELFQEAGWYPLEVIAAATSKGAELLGMEDQIGTIRSGMKADIQILDENPLENFKILYGTGHQRLETSTGELKRIRALRYVIKDGIIYDAGKLLEDCKDMVAKQRELEVAQK